MPPPAAPTLTPLYKSQNGKLNHLFYMDDLKTFATDDDQQTDLLTIVKTFSDDINMEFGLDKCAKATFKRGRLSKTQTSTSSRRCLVLLLLCRGCLVGLQQVACTVSILKQE